MPQTLPPASPYNPFGLGDNADARNYIAQNTISTRQDHTARPACDRVGGYQLSSSICPVVRSVSRSVASIVVKPTSTRQDPLVENGYTFYNAIAAFKPPPSFEVKEVFGEIRIPRGLKDRALCFSELTTTASGTYFGL